MFSISQELFQDELNSKLNSELELNSQIILNKIRKKGCSFNIIEDEDQGSNLQFFFNLGNEIHRILDSHIQKIKNYLTQMNTLIKLNAKIYMNGNIQQSIDESIQLLLNSDQQSYYIFCQSILTEYKLSLYNLYQLISFNSLKQQDIGKRIQESSKSQSKELSSKKYNKERKCTMISINWTQEKQQLINQIEVDEQNFQFFDFFIYQQNEARVDFGCNQYESRLRDFNLKTFHHLYKYFLKFKICQFKPKFIIVSFGQTVSRTVCEYLISKLNKLCQKMIIFIFPSQQNKDQIYGCVQGCQNLKSNKFQEDLTINPVEAYENYKNIYKSFIKTEKERTYYKSQLISLKLLCKNNLGGNNEQIDEEDQMKSELNFPYICDDTITIHLRILSQILRITNILLIIKGKITQILWDQKSQQVITKNNIAYQVYEKETYFYYEEKIFIFYGYNKQAEWSQDIRVYDFREKNWQIYKKSENSDCNPYYHRNHIGKQLVEKWFQFSVVPCFVNSGSQLHFSLVGGNLDGSPYLCNLIEDIVFLDNYQYRSSVWRKEVYKNSFKESLSPLLLKLKDNQFIFFEGKSNQSLNSSPFSRVLLVTMKDLGKYKIICEQVQMNQKSYQLFNKYANYINSTSCNLYKEDDKKYKILINTSDKVGLEQSQLSQSQKLKNLSKCVNDVYQILQFQFKIEQNVVHLEISEQEYICSTLQNAINTPQCLTKNWVDNIDDTQLYLDEEPYVYVLKYEDKHKRFTFENFDLEYDEKAIINYEEQIITVVRLIVPNQVEIYQVPFIYLQDVRDSIDDNEIVGIQLNKCFQFDITDNSNILYFYQYNETEFMIQLNNEHIIVERFQMANQYQWKVKGKTLSLFNQNINLQKPLIQFAISAQIYLFYENVQVTDNYGIIKYFVRGISQTAKVNLNQKTIDKFNTHITISINQIQTEDISVLRITFFIQNSSEFYLQNSLFNLTDGQLKYVKDIDTEKITRRPVHHKMPESDVSNIKSTKQS